MKDKTAMKDLYKELDNLQDELDDLTYLGNDLPYAEFKEQNDKIVVKMDKINKALGGN